GHDRGQPRLLSPLAIEGHDGFRVRIGAEGDQAAGPAWPIGGDRSAVSLGSGVDDGEGGRAADRPRRGRGGAASRSGGRSGVRLERAGRSLFALGRSGTVARRQPDAERQDPDRHATPHSHYILNVANGAHRGLSVRRQQGGSTGRGVDVVAGLAGGLARLFRPAGRARGGVARGHAFAGERVVDDVLVRINLGARRRAAPQGAGAGVGARISALQRLVQRVAQVAAIGLLAHGGGFAAFVVFGL